MDCRVKPGNDQMPRDFMRRAFRIASDAYCHFNDDDGWAIASHIAFRS